MEVWKETTENAETKGCLGAAGEKEELFLQRTAAEKSFYLPS